MLKRILILFTSVFFVTLISSVVKNDQISVEDSDYSIKLSVGETSKERAERYGITVNTDFYTVNEFVEERMI